MHRRLPGWGGCVRLGFPGGDEARLEGKDHHCGSPPPHVVSPFLLRWLHPSLLMVGVFLFPKELNVRFPQISEVISAQPPEHQRMAPLLKAPLTSEQWKALEDIHEVLRAEYQCRKRMMLTRFDVTVASFHWSERAKDRSLAMSEAFQPLRQTLPEDSQISLAHLLAAREDFSRIVKTSSGSSRNKTSCAVNKVLTTGNVPDRGGRPNEIEPPMPTWEKRREGGGGGGQRWGKRGKKKK